MEPAAHFMKYLERLLYLILTLQETAMLNSKSGNGRGGGMMDMESDEEGGGDQTKNYHQLDRLVIQVKKSEQ